MILVAFPEMMPLAERLAPALGAEPRVLDWHRFPDGESLVSLPGDLEGADVALLATLRDPDRLALPLRFTAATAREMHARRVGLIAPYLGYMRQDRRFEAGHTGRGRAGRRTGPQLGNQRLDAGDGLAHTCTGERPDRKQVEQSAVDFFHLGP